MWYFAAINLKLGTLGYLSALTVGQVADSSTNHTTFLGNDDTSLFPSKSEFLIFSMIIKGCQMSSTLIDSSKAAIQKCSWTCILRPKCMALSQLEHFRPPRYTEPDEVIPVIHTSGTTSSSLNSDTTLGLTTNMQVSWWWLWKSSLVSDSGLTGPPKSVILDQSAKLLHGRLNRFKWATQSIVNHASRCADHPLQPQDRQDLISWDVVNGDPHIEVCGSYIWRAWRLSMLHSEGDRVV